jgi:hypothetical protein
MGPDGAIQQIRFDLHPGQVRARYIHLPFIKGPGEGDGDAAGGGDMVGELAVKAIGAELDGVQIVAITPPRDPGEGAVAVAG